MAFFRQFAVKIEIEVAESAEKPEIDELCKISLAGKPVLGYDGNSIDGTKKLGSVQEGRKQMQEGWDGWLSGIKVWIASPHGERIVWVFGLAVLLGLAIVIGRRIIRRSSGKEKMVFIRRERILTKNEFRFMKALQQATQDMKVDIFPMLRVSEILRVKKQSSRKKYYLYFNQISRKHMDFTLCRQEDNEILCCVELEERLPLQEKRERRDRFIVELFEKTGVALARLKSSAEEYDVEMIRTQIQTAIDRNEAKREEQRNEKKRLLLEKKKRMPGKNSRNGKKQKEKRDEKRMPGTNEETRKEDAGEKKGEAKQ